jgi:hypothetical protein
VTIPAVGRAPRWAATAVPPPAVDPIGPADVKAWLKIDPSDTTDDEILVPICDATMAYVAALPYVAGLDPALDWPADVRLGTTMLAAKLYRRRLSPSGIDAVTDAGAVYVARADPDVARLLHLDSQAYPRVG